MDIKQLLVAHFGQMLVVAALAFGAMYSYDEGNSDASRGLLLAAGVVAGLTPAVGVFALAAMVLYAAVLEVEGKDGGLGGARVRFLATWGLLPLAATMLLATPFMIGYMRKCVPGGKVMGRVMRAAKGKKSGKGKGKGKGKGNQGGLFF